MELGCDSSESQDLGLELPGGSGRYNVRYNEFASVHLGCQCLINLFAMHVVSPASQLSLSKPINYIIERIHVRPCHAKEGSHPWNCCELAVNLFGKIPEVAGYGSS